MTNLAALALAWLPSATAVGAVPSEPATPALEVCTHEGDVCDFAGFAANQPGLCERAEDCSRTPNPTLCLVCASPEAHRVGGCQLVAPLGSAWAGAALALALGRRRGRRRR